MFNTAIALGRLGARTGFFSGLSADFFGDLLRDSLAAARVDDSLCVTADRPCTLAFVQLLDFESVYRVTGPFSAMHRGGAYLECFLAVASAFALTLVLRARHWPVRGAAAALLLATGYAVMVTYSRNGYVAWGVVLMLGLVNRGLGVVPARWISDGAPLVAGALLGGSFGLGTVLFAVGMGPMVKVGLRRLRYTPHVATPA